MSLVNAELIPASENTPSDVVRMRANDFSDISDRALMEYIATRINAALDIAEGVSAEITPTLEKLKKNPLLGGFLR